LGANLLKVNSCNLTALDFDWLLWDLLKEDLLIDEIDALSLKSSKFSLSFVISRDF
jgi:hypothetical protein